MTLPKEAVQPIMANITIPQEPGSLVNHWLPQDVQGGAGKTQKVWVGDGFPLFQKRAKCIIAQNKKWSQINPLLYNQLFTARANELAF